MSLGGGVNVGSIEADVKLNIGQLDSQLERVKSGVANVESQIERLNAEFQASGVSIDGYNAEMQRLVGLQNQLIRAQESLEESIRAATIAEDALRESTQSLTQTAQRSVAAAVAQTAQNQASATAFQQAATAAVANAAANLKSAQAAQQQAAAPAGARSAQAATQQAQASYQAAQAATQQAQAALQAAQAVQAQAAAQTKAAGAGQALTRQLRGASLAGLSLSRAGQDVAQAGWAAALNNVEFASAGLAQAFGATIPQAAAVGAVMQGVATAAYMVVENWDTWMDKLGMGIPTPAIDGLEGLKAELKDVDKQIDELHKKARLSLPELLKLNAAQQRSAQLEKDVEEQKAIDKMDGPSKEAKQRGQAFEDAVKSQGLPHVRDALTEHFADQADKEGQRLDAGQITDLFKTQGLDPGKMTRQQANDLGKSIGMKFDLDKMQGNADAAGGKPIGKQVKDLIAQQQFLLDKATNRFVTPEKLTRSTLVRGGQGDEDAIKATTDILNAKGMKDFSKEYTESSPEGKAAAKDQAKAAKDQAKAARERKAARAKLQRTLKSSLAKFRTSVKTTVKSAASKREQEEKRLADDFMKGKSGQRAIEGMSEDEVEAGLVETGMDKGKAKEVSGRVLGHINKKADEKVREFALEHGMTGKEARGEMIAEAREKEEQQDETIRARDVKRANKVLPGLDKQVESRLTIGEAMGGDRGQIGEDLAKAVERALLAKGIDPMESKRTAKAVVEEGQQSVDKKISDKAQDLDIDAAGAAKRRASEVFDGSELSRKVQSAVGAADDIPKKQLSMLEKSEQHLAIIAAQRQGNQINMKVKR